MTNYVIPFWIVVSIVILVISILVWLSIVKSRDNKVMHIGYIGMLSLVEHYLSRSLEKVVYFILTYEKFQAKKGMDIRLSAQQKKWIQETAPTMTRAVMNFFGRGESVAQELYLQRDTSLEQVDLFLLPDVVVQTSKVAYYKDLLTVSSHIVTNDSSLFDQYTNDEARSYLLALLSNMTKNKKDTDKIELSSPSGVIYMD